MWLRICAQVGSMTFSLAMTTHLDEADSRSWLGGPKNRTSPQIFMSPNSLRVMVIRHPFERLASLYNFMLQGSPVSSIYLKGDKIMLQTLTQFWISVSFENFKLVKKMLHFSFSWKRDYRWFRLSSDGWGGEQNTINASHTIMILGVVEKGDKEGAWWNSCYLQR